MYKKNVSLLLLSCLYLTANDNSHFYAGGHLNYVRLNFEEQNKLKGYLAGVTTGYEYQRPWFFTELNFEGYWNAGPISGRPAQRSDVNEYFVKLKLGTSFCTPCHNLTIKPYIGFGYDHFRNEQDPHIDGLSYKYNKLFIPVGIYGCWCAHPNMMIGLQGEWRPDVYARVKVIGEKIKIKRKNAARVQMPFTFFAGCQQDFTVSLVPFFDWNQFGKTTETNSNNIPLPVDQLNRWYLGFRLLFGYIF